MKKVSLLLAEDNADMRSLLKWLLERIHISKGMLKIRISVMELGRFTLADSIRNPAGFQF